MAFVPGTFASFTIQRRLPRILADVRSQLDQGDRDDPRWSALESAIVSGGEIDLRLLSADTPFWRSRLPALAGQSWAQQPFFDLEFLFYQAINSIADDLRPDFDVFAAARRASLSEALPRVARLLDATDAPSLEVALLLAMSGNEADLSQLIRDHTGTATRTILRDERSAIGDRLRGTNDGTVQVLADNAGAELCFDLVLVDVLLATRTGRVELQLKSRPMFVSDALISDVEETVDGFVGQGGSGRLGPVGARLRRAIGEQRLVLRAPPDWAEPRHMNALEADLTASLRAADLVLAKGDLNYRRFFEDRAWPADAPVRTASVATGMHAFALRVLKSDSVVGLHAADVSRLFAADPDWRSNGKYAVVQRVDRGAG